MKSSLRFSIASVAIVILSLQVPQFEVFSANIQSFEQWCLQKDSLPAETKRTVEVMLMASGTQECRLADVKLNSLTILDLSANQISRNKPPVLRGANQIQIGDINPQYLRRAIQISDIKPLASLTNRNCST